MLNQKQLERMLGKLVRFEHMISKKIFDKVGSIEDVKRFQTKEQRHCPPEGVEYIPTAKGDTWGGDEYVYCWFKGSYKVPAELEGKRLYLAPHMGGYEGFLFVDGFPCGIFANKLGNHYCDMLVKKAKAGQEIAVDLEFYTGHYVAGCFPYETAAHETYNFTYESMDVCVKNEAVADFYFDLRTVNELVEVLPESSFRKGELVRGLFEIHEMLYYSTDHCSNEEFMEGISKAAPVLKALLDQKNSASAPEVGVIGHSHMDTAWLWPIRETVKKCARTYANQLSLMEQYDEYNFIQSSAYHSQMIEENYPSLFEAIKERVKEGRYEPNGGVWIECDCNITSGESMIRQFLWGQRYTRKHFGYTSDAFWLPDTFGYSAAIPQILRGCDIKYFLTTKMAWNDTNLFPYDSFYWKGIDGSTVLAHLNKTHICPSPKDMYDIIHNPNNNDGLRQKHVTNKKLVSYGVGDGGGGPEFEMIEMSRRIADVDGAPKVKSTTVSKFMQELESTAKGMDTYNGELYLELHRGTLTNQHEIKRNNRLGEIALHNLEFLTVQDGVKSGKAVDDSAYHGHMNTLLVNQFHDILPGTCYNQGNAQAREEVSQLLADTNRMIGEFGTAANDAVTVVNTTSFELKDPIYLDESLLNGKSLEGGVSQSVTALCGTKKVAFLADKPLPSYGGIALKLTEEASQAPSPFKFECPLLETPFAIIRFNDRMYMESFVDKSNGRELRGQGYPLNTLLVAEDLPTAWDNWDVDADLEYKFKDSAELISTEVISDGGVELRIRNKYKITEKSTVTQDMVFYAHSPMVKLETVMDWQDTHRFLKAAYDTSIMTPFARSEIQFGYLNRPTTRNTSFDQAKFEVLNHKYTDLSEQNYGFTLLNDSKYALSVFEGQMRLSLHKGGIRPDTAGDKGNHYCEYALLPHQGGFAAESVVKPAYALNYKPVVLKGALDIPSLAAVDSDNIVIETVKPCEDGGNAFILRVYDAVGGYTNTELYLGFKPKSVAVTNMLEEVQQTLPAAETVSLTFKPFEIKTIRVEY